jgi:hypothetical protein
MGKFDVSFSDGQLAEGSGAELEAVIRGAILSHDPEAEITFTGLTPAAPVEVPAVEEIIAGNQPGGSEAPANPPGPPVAEGGPGA